MSKFFQALENAQKERVAETAATVESERPAAVGAQDSAVLVAPAQETPAAAGGALAATAVVAAPVGANGTTTAPGAGPAVTYGAPVARRRRGRGTHADAFVDPFDPASADEARQLDDHLVSLLAPTGFAAEQYRTVRLAIETYRRERGLHVVGVSSPGRREGKSLTAINIAGALAQSADARVVLVEADLRHPRIATYLGLPAGHGLSAYLLDTSLGVDDVVQKSAAAAFSVVVAGPASSMPYELLKSPRLAALFQTLRARFDYVVVDTPPVLLFPDVGILRDAIDGFVMVVRANHTPREGVLDGLDTLGGHRVVGLLFNDDDRHVAATSDVEPETGWRRYFSFRLGGSLVD